MWDPDAVLFFADQTTLTYVDEKHGLFSLVRCRIFRLTQVASLRQYILKPELLYVVI